MLSTYIQRKKESRNYARDALRKSAHRDSEAKHSKYAYPRAVEDNVQSVPNNQHKIWGKWAYMFPLFLVIEIVGKERSCACTFLQFFRKMSLPLILAISNIPNAYAVTTNYYESLHLLVRGSESSPARQIRKEKRNRICNEDGVT